MLADLDGSDLVSEVIMLRAAFKGTILLLEGPNDCKLLDRFVDAASCQSLPAHGKERLIAAVLTLDAIPVGGILGIVDPDFWALEGGQSPSPNILAWDKHDVEMTIIHSAALDVVLGQIGSRSKVEAILEERRMASARDPLLATATAFGALRWINVRDGLSLRFEGLNIASYVDPQTLEPNRRRFIEAVLGKTRNPKLKTEDIRARLDEVIGQGIDEAVLCTGPDVICVLEIALRRVFGSQRRGAVTAELIGIMLRVAFDWDHLRNTNLYYRVRDWEAVNAPYRVWAA